MRIENISSESGSDFSAVLVCEHCGEKKAITNGYHDNYYHTRVIPEMYCSKCGRNRAGVTSPQEAQRCLKLLQQHRGEWPWYMTDEEFRIARTELGRVPSTPEGSHRERHD